MRVVAIIQARMGSSRLPGKVMKSLGGKPVLAHVIERVRAVPQLDEIVVATTVQAEDDVIASAAGTLGTRVFRGSEQDVLDRYYQAARTARAGTVVRITSDCPFLDPVLVGAMVERFISAQRDDARGPDYMSNTLSRSYPRGFDAEVFAFSALERAWREAAAPAEREHVTPYIYGHPELFKLAEHVGPVDLSKYRLTLDTDDDWRLLLTLCNALECGKRMLASDELIAFFEAHPEVARLNAHVQQNTVGI